VRLVSKRQPETLQATPHSAKPALTPPKRLPLAGAASTPGIQPDAEEAFINALSDLLVADALRPKPRLRLRHRPVERAKPVLVVRRSA
jgi:hypothetical protein